MPNFSSLDEIFMLIAPIDESGNKTLRSGRKLSEPESIEELLTSMLDNGGRGVKSTGQFVNRIATFGNKSQKKLPEGTRIYHNLDSSIADVEGINANKITINEIAGADINKSNKEGEAKKTAMLFSNRAPKGSENSSIYPHVSNLGTRRVETFLNCMPSTVIASLVPCLDVEFEVKRKDSRLGQIRFLMGDSDEKGNIREKDKIANDAMIKAKQLTESGNVVSNFAGMELFTSPQTLVNPEPNLGGGRYNDVLDPFRPFASIESLSVSVVPTVGWETNKTAQLNIKLHDRSRLNEISDLVRPQIYAGEKTTVWLTYGWRAPIRGARGENPYFDYVNEHMVMREAYHIKNANFSFDQVGQVLISLDLYTKGSLEFGIKPITESLTLDRSKTLTGNSTTVKELITKRKELASRIIDKFNEKSPGTEVRAYQIINATNDGKYLSITPKQAEKLINEIQKKLDLGDKDDLIADLKKLYVGKENAKNTEKNIQTEIAKESKNRIKELTDGRDPFLEGLEPGLQGIVNDMGANKEKSKEVVSFGKLFSVFALNCFATSKDINDIQVFFYGLNSSCGPMSGHSIAEMPIKISYFQNAYSSLIQSLGSEDIPLSKFMEFIKDSMLLDDRSPAFGFDKYYSNPTDGSAPTIKNQKGYESTMESYLRTYGSYRKPFIEVYVEASYESPDAESMDPINGMFDKLGMPNTTKTNNINRKKVVRIHIYDKVLNPNESLSKTLIKTENGSFAVTSKEQLKDELARKVISKSQGETFQNSAQVRDYLSRFVPTITYGTNGSTIINANLATKFDALQSTVAMQKSNVVSNNAQPNGTSPGGIPLRIIPATLSLTTIGCPPARMNQIYYVNFATGTSIDNFYNCTSITHTLAAGKFETQWSLAPADAYGIFEAAPTVEQLEKVMNRSSVVNIESSKKKPVQQKKK